MPDILHRIGVEQSSPDQVYDALTTLDGIRSWWVDGTTGETDDGGVTQFRLESGGADIKVVQRDPGRSVRWEVVDGAQEWVGTHMQWDLREDDGYTIVLLKHEGWREPSEFMHHCSTKWGSFMLSLKQLLENGEGAPAPRDVKLDNWD
jgi:uncharacterized protein YndB with AHSA1/START domain